MGDTGPRDSLEAPGCEDTGLELWISLFIACYSEQPWLVPVFIGSLFHMNHSSASENRGLEGVCQGRVLEFIIPEENLLLDIFMEGDVWFQHFQKQINIYKSNKTPQQKDSKRISRAICPCQESLGQQEAWWGAVDRSSTMPHTQQWQSRNRAQRGVRGWLQRADRSRAINTLPKEV